MRIAVDADLIVTRLKHISLRVLIIIGSHILCVECDRHYLGSARLKSRCLLKRDQVRACFLDTAVCVRRIVVYFYYVLTRHIPCVCYRNIKGDCSVSFCDLTHFLSECCVRKSVSERIYDCLVIVDQAFCRSRLPETVSHIDAVHIVYKARRNDLLCSIESDLCHVELFCVVIEEASEVVPCRSCCQVCHECIACLTGRIHFTAQDPSKSIESGLTCARAPQSAFDLLMLVEETKFHSICTVVYNNDVVKVFAYKVQHIFLCLA